MKISYNWLKEYFKTLPSPDKLAERLTMAGLEVEGIEPLNKGIQGVVVAQVLSVDKHPNADRLSFCKVQTDKGVHSIVCGAKNMKAGDKVALALPGAVLPKGIKIEKTKIRGVESEGMMCSESELGLKDVSEGIIILPQDLAIGKDFIESMGLNDTILNVNVTPNRPDCLSILGVAREAGAITKKSLKLSKTKTDEQGKDIKKLISVSIEEPSLCRRYSARVVENVKVAPSPDWLKRRLETVGFRPINNVVDVTNYVMIEYGHPLHAFDYELVSDKRIVVRRAQENEKMQTLDGVERTLTSDMLVIADANKPIALAGIMGGKESEINDSTINILLESAYFEPACIRKTSKTLGLSTESSYRFERGADIEGVTKALDKAAQMIKELAGGDIANGIIDKYPRPHKRVIIKVRLSRINKLLGTELMKEEVEDCFKRLHIDFTAENASGKKKQRAKTPNPELRTPDFSWNVTPPSFRVDILREVDIIEEIARIYGYENIQTTLPTAGLSAAKSAEVDLIRQKVRDILTNNGFLEAINYSFVSEDLFKVTAADAKNSLNLLNPLTEEQSIMRQSLIPSLLQNLRYNLHHNNRDIRIFEIGRVFVPGSEETDEREKISGLISGLRYGERWNVVKDILDFYDIKGALEQILTGLGVRLSAISYQPSAANYQYLHPGKMCVFAVNNTAVGAAGEIHPDIMQRLDIKQPAYVFELDMNAIAATQYGQKKYIPLPWYPVIIRDAAMILDKDIPFQELYISVKGLKSKLLEEVNVFDVYYGGHIPDGKVSIAMRFIYRSDERTLTDDEVNEAHSAILENLKHKFGIEVRGEEGGAK